MTLVVGTKHWKGICLNSDTRVTCGDVYIDNVQKLVQLKGGISLAVTGNVSTAKKAKEYLEIHLDNKDFITQVNMKDNFYDLLRIVFDDLANDEQLRKNNPDDTECGGILAILDDKNEPLKLSSEECIKLMNIILNESFSSTIQPSILGDILMCANGQCSEILIPEYNNTYLYSFHFKVFNDGGNTSNKSDIQEIKFGEIIALGSGSQFDYKKFEEDILSWVLFHPESVDNIENASFNLAKFNAEAEEKISNSKYYDFKTFGGAILPGFVRHTTDGNSQTAFCLGDIIYKKDNKIYSRTYMKDGKLYLVTPDGKNQEVIPFNSIKTNSTSSMFY